MDASDHKLLQKFPNSYDWFNADDNNTI